MPIHFSEERWNKVRKNYTQWWDGTLKRPLMKMTVRNAYQPSRPEPKAPLLCQAVCDQFQYSPEELIDRWDYELEQYEFLGDAFPFINFDFFGPGVLAAFCGAKLDNSSGGVWFFPTEKKDISQIHIHYDPENIWARRIKDLYRAGNQRWQGQVLMGMTDLGGILDVIASFRESENLLLDLYDAPEEVLRLCRETQQAWMDAYNDLNSVLQPVNPGYSDWSGIYSKDPSYVIQSDFSYMIGTEMFDEFALPFLKESCDTLTNTIYHLDGQGELKHLDHLLEIPSLNAVQWVWGDGSPTGKHWVDVYQKIAASGKGIHLIGGDQEDFDTVLSQVKGRFYMYTEAKDCDQGKQILDKYGIPLYG
ncbi:MAG: hypothetical protein ACOX60_02050 [Massiliimalia sp.]|jgi:hypothetical protein